MENNGRKHRLLTKCHVLFLGSSVPTETSRGLDALQAPLMRCYPVDKATQIKGIDAWLSIYSSGILLQLVADRGPSPPVIWFPIQNMYVVAATKCVNYIDAQTNQRFDSRFMEINDPAAKKSSHPPLFSMIVRKTTGRKVLQCYSFLTQDEAPAVAMVEAAHYAFEDKSGWAEGHPPMEVSVLLMRTILVLEFLDQIQPGLLCC